MTANNRPGHMHQILWRRVDLPGMEFCKLTESDSGVKLSGVVVTVHEGKPCNLRYSVRCDGKWRTRKVKVRGWIGETRIRMKVRVGRDLRWFLNGKEVPAVEGCVDVDLGFSPSTNLLPIRRLGLGVGEESAVRAAWLPFPALAFEVLEQTYRREGPRTYTYTSRGGQFQRTLELNEVGLVTSYPGIWEMEASLGS